MRIATLSLSAFLLALLISCNKIKPDELTGNWKVIEHAKYLDGGSPEFQENLPYFFLHRYAQGIQFNEEGTFYHRFSPDGSTWTTSPSDSHGAWELKDNHINLTVDQTAINAEVIEWKNDILWLKYGDGSHYFEYKLSKE